jgi:hypothetical protein
LTPTIDSDITKTMRKQERLGKTTQQIWPILAVRAKRGDAEWMRKRAKLHGESLGQHLGTMRTIIEGAELKNEASYRRAKEIRGKKK